MTLRELMDRLVALCPDAMFDESGEGEVVVYTGLRKHDNDDWLQGRMPVAPLTEN